MDLAYLKEVRSDLFRRLGSYISSPAAVCSQSDTLFCVLLDVLSSFWLFLFRELILEGTWTPLEEVGVGPDVGITASILKVVFSIDLVPPTFLLH